MTRLSASARPRNEPCTLLLSTGVRYHAAVLFENGKVARIIAYDVPGHKEYDMAAGVRFATGDGAQFLMGGVGMLVLRKYTKRCVVRFKAIPWKILNRK